MAGGRSGNLVIAGVALGVALLAGAGVLIVGASRHDGGTTAAPAAGASSVSRGEVIFQTGRDASGAVIPRSGGASGRRHDGRRRSMGGMMGDGCATCHGSDGRGLTTAAFTAPNITYANLTDPQGMLMPDGSRGPVYSDAAIRTAVITGVDPSGAHLEAPMPQWQLTDQQWADLLSYLKTLQ